MSTYLIVCGGTGGHLTPGIALAQKLKEKHNRCILVISQKKVDTQIMKKYAHLPYEQAPGVYFSLHPKHLCRFFGQFFKSLVFYKKLIEKTQPDCIIGFGGFLTVASVLVGFYKKVPCVLHEANRVVGRSIRLISMLASRIYLPIGISLRSFPPKSIRYCACPVRDEIKRIPRHIARYKLNLPIKGTLLVVIGGSQGAQSLNRWAKDHLSIFAANAINILCITGSGEEEYLNPSTANCAVFKPFSDNMAAVLSAADLVISRAGAGSLAEIVRCEAPSILIPYPHAADKHQDANARFLEQQGCAIVIPHKKMSSLAQEAIAVLSEPEVLRCFRKNLQRLNYTDTLQFMVDDLEELMAQVQASAKEQAPKA